MNEPDRYAVHRRHGIATVLVGDGHRANALRSRDWAALTALFDDFAADSTLRAIVVSGRANTSFCAGSDMREWVDAAPEAIDASFEVMENAFAAIERTPVPVIALVRGVAAGAGCQLACACDVRIVAADTKIGMPIARWGILVSPAFLARIALLTGLPAARELLLTGRMADGAEAVRLGLATTLVPAQDLDDAASALAAQIASMPPAAIRAVKRSANVLLEPERRRLRVLQAGHSADYQSMQPSLAGFLASPVEGLSA